MPYQSPLCKLTDTETFSNTNKRIPFEKDHATETTTRLPKQEHVMHILKFTSQLLTERNSRRVIRFQYYGAYHVNQTCHEDHRVLIAASCALSSTCPFIQRGHERSTQFCFAPEAKYQTKQKIIITINWIFLFLFFFLEVG